MYLKYLEHSKDVSSGYEASHITINSCICSFTYPENFHIVYLMINYVVCQHIKLNCIAIRGNLSLHLLDLT